MAKKSKSKNKIGAAVQVDPYLEGLINKLVERFVGLEKKVDLVIAQTAGKSLTPANAPKPFQAPPINQPPRRDRTLYEAICADCQKVCEVPFRPSEDRPVYCKECFAKRKSSNRPSGNPNKGPMNLTPVSLPPKPVGKLGLPPVLPPAMASVPKKSKKKSPDKKAKKKKSK